MASEALLAESMLDNAALRTYSEKTSETCGAQSGRGGKRDRASWAESAERRRLVGLDCSTLRYERKRVRWEPGRR